MNGRPGTKAELGSVTTAANFLRAHGLDADAARLESLYVKLTAPFKPRPDLPDPHAIESALARGVFPNLTVFVTVSAGEAWWAGVARKAAGVGANPADAELVGRWLATQPWAKAMTVDRLLSGWPSYLARAKAAGRTDDSEGWTRRELGELAPGQGDGA